MSAEHKRDYSISMLRANLLALLIGLPVATAQLSLFVFLHGALQVPIILPGALLFLVIMLASIVAHELIHGLTWQLAGGSAAVRVTYGVQ